MKKFTAALLAAALTLPSLATPAMAEQRPQHQQAQNHAPSYKTFRKGDRFDRRYARNYHVIDYRKYRKLKAPPRGYHYVQSGNDILLVGITSGIVASAFTGAIR